MRPHEIGATKTAVPAASPLVGLSLRAASQATRGSLRTLAVLVENEVPLKVASRGIEQTGTNRAFPAARAFGIDYTELTRGNEWVFEPYPW